MSRVQERGGQAVNIGIGAGVGAGGHHTAAFDIDERALSLAVTLLSAATLDLLARQPSHGQPAPTLERPDAVAGDPAAVKVAGLGQPPSPST